MHVLKVSLLVIKMSKFWCHQVCILFGHRALRLCFSQASSCFPHFKSSQVIENTPWVDVGTFMSSFPRSAYPFPVVSWEVSYGRPDFRSFLHVVCPSVHNLLNATVWKVVKSRKPFRDWSNSIMFFYRFWRVGLNGASTVVRKNTGRKRLNCRHSEINVENVFTSYTLLHWPGGCMIAGALIYY